MQSVQEKLPNQDWSEIEMIGNEEVRVEQILSLLLAKYNQKVGLFFDNLESVQAKERQEIGDETIKGWIGAGIRLAEQGLTLLLTSRWRLPDWGERGHLPLTGASYGDFLRMGQEQLPSHFLGRRAWMRRAYEVLGGNGRGLSFLAGAVAGMDAEAEAEFMAKLAEAKGELQANMMLGENISRLPKDAKALLYRMPAYKTAVPIEGVIKLGLDLAEPEAALARLLAVSLLEEGENLDWQAVEYQLDPLARDWLVKNNAPNPSLATLKKAGLFQQYLLEQERHTLAQAVVAHRALTEAAETTTAHRLALDWIVGRLNRAGLYHDLLENWLPQICTAEDLGIRGEALGQMGKQYHHIGDYESALDFLNRSLKICQDIGEREGEGTTLNNISLIYSARGDYESALDFLSRSLKIRQDIGDKSGEGTTLNNISLIYSARGDYESALDFLYRSLKIWQDIGDKSGEGTTLNNISQIYHARGDYESALDFLHRSLKIRQDIGDKSGEGTTLNNISQIYHARGDYESALDFLNRSLIICQDIGDVAGEGTTLNNIGQIYKARGDYESALDFLNRSLKIQQDIGDKWRAKGPP